MFISKNITNDVAKQAISSVKRVDADKILSFKNNKLIVFNCSYEFSNNSNRLITALTRLNS